MPRHPNGVAANTRHPQMPVTLAGWRQIPATLAGWRQMEVAMFAKFSSKRFLPLVQVAFLGLAGLTVVLRLVDAAVR